MKVKLVGRSGERVYDCEDVTITYYTEKTLAFRDAHDAWKKEVEKVKAALATVASRARRQQETGAVAAQDCERLKLEHDELISGRKFPRLTSWILRTSPWHSDPVDELQEALRIADRDRRLALQSVQELKPHVEAAERAVKELVDDEVTPGIEFSLRMAKSRRQVNVYLPADGDALYIENEAGDTIDSYRWPIKSAPRPVLEAEREVARRRMAAEQGRA